MSGVEGSTTVETAVEPLCCRGVRRECGDAFSHPKRMGSAVLYAPGVRGGCIGGMATQEGPVYHTRRPWDAFKPLSGTCTRVPRVAPAVEML